MKFFCTILLIIVSPCVLNAQLSVASGDSIYVITGTTFTLQDNLMNEGKIVGTGRLILNGSSTQQLSGKGNINTLKLSNNAKVIEDLNINSGLTIDASYTLDLNDKGIVSNGFITTNGYLKGSKLSYITLNGAGAGNTLQFDQTTDETTNALYSLDLNGNTATTTISNKLNIFGSVSPTLGTLTLNDEVVLKSISTSTARVGQVGGSISYNTNGKFTVERYYPAKRSWRLATAPLSNTGSIFSTWQNSGVYEAGKGMFVTGPNPTGSSGNGLDYSVQNNYSIKSYSNNQYVNIGNTITNTLSTTSSSSANKGYFVFVRGDRSRNPDNTYIPNTNVTTLKASGKLLYGTQSFSVTSNPLGFELIGNPYASPVDFNQLTKTNIYTHRFYVYDPNFGQVGAFVVMEDFDIPGTFTPSNIILSAQDNYIQSGQAFFVLPDGTNTAGTIKFEETHKSSNNNLNMFRPMHPNTYTSIRADLYMKDPGSMTLADGSLAQFNDDFSEGVDIKDALKFPNVNENIGFFRNNFTLCVERRPMIKETDTLFLRLSKTSARDYTFRFAPAKLDRNNLAAFLEDKYLNTSTPLYMNSNTDVDFSVSTVAASAAADRFRIVFRPSVKYAGIDAYPVDKNVAIDWNVSGEVNLKDYEVERSRNGGNFEKLGTQPATGTATAPSSYKWIDVEPEPGNYSYRIKSVSNHGVMAYSDTANVTIINRRSAYFVYPNPVVDGRFNLRLNEKPKGEYAVRIINPLGQVINSCKLVHSGGSATHTIRPAINMANGNYQLEVTDTDGHKHLVPVLVKSQN